MCCYPKLEVNSFYKLGEISEVQQAIYSPDQILNMLALLLHWPRQQIVFVLLKKHSWSKKHTKACGATMTKYFALANKLDSQPEIPARISSVCLWKMSNLNCCTLLGRKTILSTASELFSISYFFILAKTMSPGLRQKGYQIRVPFLDFGAFYFVCSIIIVIIAILWGW